jgi:hypothetical protein
MSGKIALPRRTPGVIEVERPDALMACFIRFPLPGTSGQLVDIELSVSKGFDVRLDDGRSIRIAPGMGLRVGGCDYTREGFVSDVSELVGEALFTLIEPTTARLYTRHILPGTRVLVTLRGQQPRSLVSIKRVLLALETPDPDYH